MLHNSLFIRHVPSERWSTHTHLMASNSPSEYFDGMRENFPKKIKHPETLAKTKIGIKVELLGQLEDKKAHKHPTYQR